MSDWIWGKNQERNSGFCLEYLARWYGVNFTDPRTGKKDPLLGREQNWGIGLGDVGPARGTKGISNPRCQVDSWLFESEAQRNFLMEIEIGGLHKIKEDETWVIRSPQIYLLQSLSCSVIFHKHLLSAWSLAGSSLNTRHIKKRKRNSVNNMGHLFALGLNYFSHHPRQDISVHPGKTLKQAKSVP